MNFNLGISWYAYYINDKVGVGNRKSLHTNYPRPIIYVSFDIEFVVPDFVQSIQFTK